MPFPLAHPAAVLPLRRFCPRRLDFPALVIGSLVPDLGYAFGPVDVAQFSHRLVAGTFGFCLPVGWLIWLALDRIRGPAIARLPMPYRAAVPPAMPGRRWPPWVVWLSLLLGIWTHWLLDSFTHWNGWFVQHLPWLAGLLFHFGDHYVWTYDCLYYICTFVGTVCVTLAYLGWLQRATGSATGRSAGFRWGNALLLAAATIVVASKSRFAPTILVLAIGGIVTLLLLLSFVAGTALYLTKSAPRITTRQPPPVPANEADPADCERP